MTLYEKCCQLVLVVIQAPHDTVLCPCTCVQIGTFFYLPAFLSVLPFLDKSTLLLLPAPLLLLLFFMCE